MNVADLARLELAKRAYGATEPSAVEVQRGVRKARLSLRRPRERRAWFSKTLVALVLAMGGLAYAKPSALGELVSSVLQPAVTPKRGSGAGVVAAAPAVSPKAVQGTRSEPPRLAVLPEPSHAGEQPGKAAKQSVKVEPRSSKPDVGNLPLKMSDNTADGVAPDSASFRDEAGAPAASQQRLATDWGRVGSALARGDEARALAALDELSASDDQRTRDKADLGRAQLFMANGNRDQACSTARSLTNRGAGSRIERQAQVLLKNCTR